jgi:hypothetical protein
MEGAVPASGVALDENSPHRHRHRMAGLEQRLQARQNRRPTLADSPQSRLIQMLMRNRQLHRIEEGMKLEGHL